MLHKWYTISQAAKEMNLSREEIDNAIAQKELPIAYFGRAKTRIKILDKALNEWALKKQYENFDTFENPKNINDTDRIKKREFTNTIDDIHSEIKELRK